MNRSRSLITAFGAVAALAGALAMGSQPALAQMYYDAAGHLHHVRSNASHRNTNRKNTNTARRTGATTKKHKMDLAEALNLLGLNSAQRSQIDGFQEKANVAGRNATADHTMTNEQYIGKMDTINRGMFTDIKSVLTPAQKTKLESLLPEARD